MNCYSNVIHDKQSHTGDLFFLKPCALLQSTYDVYHSIIFCERLKVFLPCLSKIQPMLTLYANKRRRHSTQGHWHVMEHVKKLHADMKAVKLITKCVLIRLAKVLFNSQKLQTDLNSGMVLYFIIITLTSMLELSEHSWHLSRFSRKMC